MNGRLRSRNLFCPKFYFQSLFEMILSVKSYKLFRIRAWETLILYTFSTENPLLIGSFGTLHFLESFHIYFCEILERKHEFSESKRSGVGISAPTTYQSGVTSGKLMFKEIVTLLSIKLS